MNGDGSGLLGMYHLLRDVTDDTAMNALFDQVARLMLKNASCRSNQMVETQSKIAEQFSAMTVKTALATPR